MSAPLPTAVERRAVLCLVVAGFAISFVVIGGGIDTVGVFLNAIGHATDWSRSSLSLAVSVGALTAAASTPVVGAAVDRCGVRLPMSAGAALLGAGFAVLVVMHAPWQFAAANLLLGAGFAACALLPLTIAVTLCAPQRPALALGIVGAGASAGTLILAPALQALIDAVGWRGAYAVLGVGVVTMPLLFLPWALPRGQLQSRSPSAAAPAPGALWAELRRPGVAPLAAVMILPALASFSISVHLVPLLAGLGRTASSAALALGATVGLSAVGKVGGGLLGDRVGTLGTLRLALVVDVIAVALLSQAAAPAALMAFVPLYGLALGAQLAVIPALAVRVLGSERFGTLFGALQLAAMLASAVGPIASGLIFDWSGRYDGALALWLAALCLAAVVAFWIPAGRAPRLAERVVA